MLQIKFLMLAQNRSLSALCYKDWFVLYENFAMNEYITDHSKNTLILFLIKNYEVFMGLLMPLFSGEIL
jgi:hypothetical protein